MIQADYNHLSYVEMVQQQAVIEEVKYPTLDPIVSSNEQGVKNDEQVEHSAPLNESQNRARFLTRYYFYSILQYIGVLSLFLLTQDFRFVEVLCIVEYSPLDQDRYFYYSSEEYRNGEDYRKLFGRYDSLSKYSFRWTFYASLALTIIITLIIVIGRSSQRITRYQKCLYIVYNILIALDLGGFACISKGSWRNDAKIMYTKIVCGALIGNAFLQIMLVRLNKSHSYGKLPIILICLLSTINNLLFAFGFSYNIPILAFEVLSAYGIYYFNQLNKSLLKSPKDLPKTFNILEYINKQCSKPVAKLPDQISANLAQVKNDNFIINKRLFLVYSVIFGYLILLIILGFINTGVCIFISVLTLMSLFDTQVASQSLKDEDVFMAVCMTYVDFFSPIKNFIRSMRQ
ncbi:unnamed protein product (macronuclear) [Paramecium tetraurelia]|uniref:Uncharacterized protein n=1 Tax=Paramecium tetraurelia TaxID=5888 RepID=A0C183_PARTE|nr:uncharacterized protein GSPATT00034026001 [Paramecium tetraurelia]CAK64550.1 unnamed protein product [Paramecium tetraurelia]|eukprot:XP_001431948.1 hypothetical protein (macronuclear) [Paramecium tetraurelia strain d4-2]